MAEFIMLTKVSSEVLDSPNKFAVLEREVMERVRSECPDVEWVANYAVLGPYDYIDVFRAPDLDAAMKLAAIVRGYGHAHTEVWPAKRWSEFKQIVRELGEREPSGAELHGAAH